MPKHILTIISLIFFLSSCTPTLYSRLSKDDRDNIHYKGSYKIGEAYEKKGTKYTPQKDIYYDAVGFASWYGKKHGFHGKKTANGDKYNRSLLTAAHPTLPMPSLVKVTNLKNHKSLIVMVNDRGPFSKKRIIDVSEKAAELLGFKHHGVTKVRVQYMPTETESLLDKLSISQKEGARTKKEVKNPKCSVNCYIKVMNMKHKCHDF